MGPRGAQSTLFPLFDPYFQFLYLTIPHPLSVWSPRKKCGTRVGRGQLSLYIYILIGPVIFIILTAILKQEI